MSPADHAFELFEALAQFFVEKDGDGLIQLLPTFNQHLSKQLFAGLIGASASTNSSFRGNIEDRQKQTERAARRPITLNFDAATVLIHDLPAHGKPQPRTSGTLC